MHAGYLWERFCWLTYAPFVLYTAAVNPAYFGHLTYWTLTLHAVYFTVDKASPNATNAIYLLHGMSFAGAMAVFAGYTFISIGGTYRFGSWHTWENAVGARAGTVHHDRGLAELVVQKSYEHVWPVFASLLDVYFSREYLVKAFAGAPKLRTTLLSVASYLIFATVWEQMSKGQGKGSVRPWELQPRLFHRPSLRSPRSNPASSQPLDVYVQPQELATSSVLAKLGLPPQPSLPEDLIFTNAQKIALISVALTMYWKALQTLSLTFSLLLSPYRCHAMTLAGTGSLSRR